MLTSRVGAVLRTLRRLRPQRYPKRAIASDDASRAGSEVSGAERCLLRADVTLDPSSDAASADLSAAPAASRWACCAAAFLNVSALFECCSTWSPRCLACCRLSSRAAVSAILEFLLTALVAAVWVTVTLAMWPLSPSVALVVSVPSMCCAWCFRWHCFLRVARAVPCLRWIENSRCPSGHALQKRYAPVCGVDFSTYSCSMCEAKVKQGGSLWSCRSCNFDKCQNCMPVFEEEIRSTRQLKDGAPQPHMPVLESVEVSDEAYSHWRANHGTEFDYVLQSGAIVLVDAEWMVERAESGGTLKPRQALPSAAFMPPTGVTAASGILDSDVLHMACVSHCWLQGNHPDPRGHNLRILGRALQLLSADYDRRFRGRWAVFMDFCCIHQYCRDHNGIPQGKTFQVLDTSREHMMSEFLLEEGVIGQFKSEKVLFGLALSYLGIFYSHRKTIVFMLTQFPADYDNPASYTRSGNTAPYFERGWCYCEASWAMLTKPSTNLIDLGLSTGNESCFYKDDYYSSSGNGLVKSCAAGHLPPVMPDVFESDLQFKGFAVNDCPRVANLYRAHFWLRFRTAHVLEYTRLGWGASEARKVADLLASGATAWLETLLLDGNHVGDAGVADLAEAIQTPRALPRLQELSLSDNGVGDVGAAHLARALATPGAVPRLEHLFFLHGQQPGR
ncbi:unnamed protein product [Prorocentrum cordatum]|uniref:Kazal-like domain-containing protein n=1 Tax=Prorocentrum cordatum TaxID=2364126 RepID=A0ABN9URD0_9DINO|nr:unnamed protein product [Polarella glacialis]